MLSTSFPKSLWFFLQVMTIICITSNLSSNSQEPLKYPKVFMTNPSNWWSSKLLFRKVGFPMRFQKFLGMSVTSLLVSICISKSKLLILTFSIMSFFFCLIFLRSCFCFFTEKTCLLVSFSSTLSTFFFLNLHTAWKWLFFKQFVQILPNAGHFSFFISCSRPQYEQFLKSFLTSKYRWIFVRLVDFYHGCISVLSQCRYLKKYFLFVFV